MILDDRDSIRIQDEVFEVTKVDVEVDYERKWDVKETPGADGASETNKGYTPCTPKVSILLWTDTHREAWDRLAASIRPAGGKQPPKPITVEHAELAAAKRSRFYVKKLSGKKFIGPGRDEVVIELLEYFGTPKATGTGYGLRPGIQHEDVLLAQQWATTAAASETNPERKAAAYQSAFDFKIAERADYRDAKWQESLGKTPSPGISGGANP